MFDTTYRTIYTHNEAHAHESEFPLYDSHAFRALRASDVILDGSIQAVFGLAEYKGETFATVNGNFVYMYIADLDETTWSAVDLDMWSAVLHDGTLSADGCLSGVPPQSPPAPASPPVHPPVYYTETNATECPNGPLTADQCDAAYVVNIGPLPGDLHVPAFDTTSHPKGCIVDTNGLYEYNGESSGVPCQPAFPCLCHDPENHTHVSPEQPPAPPISPPPPSPPFAPPPYNSTMGGMALDSTVDVGGWQFELIVLEDTLTRLYFQPGFAFEAFDIVVLVPKTFTDDHPGGECGIASSLSTTGLEDDPTCALTSNHTTKQRKRLKGRTSNQKLTSLCYRTETFRTPTLGATS